MIRENDVQYVAREGELFFENNGLNYLDPILSHTVDVLGRPTLIAPTSHTSKEPMDS